MYNVTMAYGFTFISVKILNHDNHTSTKKCVRLKWPWKQFIIPSSHNLE